MSVHHCCVQLQFGVIQLCEICACHPVKDRNKNDHASLPRILDGRIYGRVITRTVVDNVRLIWPKCLLKICSKICLCCIESIVCAKALCKCKTVIRYIRYHDLVRAKCLHTLDEENTDGSAPLNDNFCSLHARETLCRVNSHCKRFDHCAFIIGQLLRQQRHL